MEVDKKLLESNLDEDMKTGIHNLLGEILDNSEIRLNGCISNNGSEIDGKEFEVETLKEFEKLKKENEIMRNSLDNCLPIDEVENKDVWERINNLINNEIEQEGLCNQ